ncbi:X-ray repair cross-complementing protein 5 isoform X2 [Suricata suricatta]|uniref:X-ray repair cross-complementing protein 5 isoform X2 n=1 Tax=Suricata suricatta TaxID=37032 RepID=UPI0011557C4D|nr:X-ray repair cross-complementing protein 5 isoform X2 [Suricata suricatta]
MARSRSKAAIVLCMDVGSAMSNSFPGEESPYELAKKVMTMFVQRQVLAESKDEVALVLFGTDGTENALAGNDQYQNITVHRHLRLPDFDLLEDIESKIQPGSQQADFLDALIVCMDVIQQETIGKKFEKRHIEVFTDLSSPFSQDQLDIIIHNLKKSGISLQFFLPFPVGKEDGTGDRGDGNWRSDHHGSSFPLKGITEQQREGIRMVKKVMTSLEGEDGLDEIYSFSESLRQLCVFKKIERCSVPWPCTLTIGSNLSIKIVAYKSIMQEKVKKCWTVVDARTLKKEDIQKETVYCLQDDDETEVPKEDTIQGFRYGSDIVPFSKVDEEQMKYKSEEKCFSVLGFCRSSQVHRRYFVGNQVLKVFAAEDDECLAHRALHPQEPLPPIQQHILNMLDPPAEVTAKCQIPLSKVKTIFPLTEAVKKKDQLTAQNIFPDNHEEGPASKKLKTEEGEECFRISSLAEGSITSVGSVNPAENFRVLVRQKKASFEEASRQLINHIEQFLDTNETPYFMKSMDCITALREEAIQVSEEQCFNNFLKALREKVEIKQLKHFWDIVVQDGITLITKDEAPGSSVTAEEAKKFLAPRERTKEDTTAMFAEGGDVDDLLDLI